jgi:hypothetical protein
MKILTLALGWIYLGIFGYCLILLWRGITGRSTTISRKRSGGGLTNPSHGKDNSHHG